MIIYLFIVNWPESMEEKVVLIPYNDFLVLLDFIKIFFLLAPTIQWQTYVHDQLPLCGILHGEIWLISNHMVDKVKSVGRQRWRENVLVVRHLVTFDNWNTMIIIMIITIIMTTIMINSMIMIRYHLIAWQEESFVVLPLNKSMSSVAVRLTRPFKFYLVWGFEGLLWKKFFWYHTCTVARKRPTKKIAKKMQKKPAQ